MSAPVPSADLAERFRNQVRAAPLYAVLDPAIRTDLSSIAILEQLLAGGVRVIQYRHKGRFGRENFDACCQMAEWVHRAGGLFIVNDRADVAALSGADGVHLGQEDLPPNNARRFLGDNKIIGYSTH